MAYRVEYAKGVVKDLKHLPRTTKARAVDVIENILADDPHQGKPLVGPYKGLRRFRIGDYRIIYTIDEDRVVVFVLRVRHRRDAYRGLR